MPETVHTAGVSLVSVTDRPEVAETDTLTGPLPRTLSRMSANATVWAAGSRTSGALVDDTPTPGTPDTFATADIVNE